jgi:sec-independent protein translocase protein TatB
MNVLGMGPMEIILIVVLALIVFGPAKLPEIMDQVGKAINDFRKATSELSDEFNRTIQAELKETRSVVEETKAVVTDAHTSVTSAISGAPAPTRTAVPAESVPAHEPNGTNPAAAASNGAVPDSPTPPLADTSQWSWETAAPKPAEVQAADGSPSGPPPIAADAPAASDVPSTTTAQVTSPAEPATSETSVGAGESAPRAPSAAAPQTPRPRSTAAKRTARDDLLPPY